jgi:uncharacterized protein YggE
MNRSTLLATTLMIAFASAVSAQTPSTVTTEAVATVRVKPDHAKIYLNLDAKAGEANGSVENSLAARKELIAAIDKLGLKNAKAIIQPQRISKDREVSELFPNAPVKQIIETYETNQQVIYTVTDHDPAKLTDAIEKIAKAAANLGVSGDSGRYIDDNIRMRRMILGGTGGLRIVYESKTGWDDAMLAGMTQATEKAVRQANALARGAGLKVIDVLKIEDITEGEPMTGQRRDNSEEDMVDGELVRKVRVRVKVSLGK